MKPNESLHWPPDVSVTALAGSILAHWQEPRQLLAPVSYNVRYLVNEFSISGKVVDGCGKFREQIQLPEDLLNGHRDWMPSFVQGTLNIQLSNSDLPQSLQSNGLRTLDLNDSFRPAIYRRGSDVLNNTIRPNVRKPKRGDVQLWRAILSNLQTQAKHKCFLIRRVESGYMDKAEILGQQNFRNDCQYESGHRVSIQVFAGAGET